jgi:pyrrolidone-carboxylate peptidase
MKKLLFLALIITLKVQAQNVILAHFDPFDGASFNNSETVANAVAAGLKNKGIKVKVCALKTSFKKAYAAFDKCLEAAPPADLVIGLGETGCQLKAEFVGRNLDKTYGPDNDGENRDNTPIIPGAQSFLSLRYPLPQMYCGLSKSERNLVALSNNAGSFVCNNVAYQMRYHHPEKMIGFIHVPSHNCKNLNESNKQNVALIGKMILKGLSTQDNDAFLPHASNSEEIPMTKNEIRNAQNSFDDPCYQEFYKTIKAVDGRRLWPF